MVNIQNTAPGEHLTN